ncbi:kinase-like domain-containing protein [Rhizophagus irregularis DAOM 181602=DAOM 197198]|nr:kinase-like domain-containing protein [Rhizophagus irregularis DAOM 181602=DAOM 197198]
MKQIGEGGFAKVYSATWIDGTAKYIRQDDGNWIKKGPESMKVALKMLNGLQNMSADFSNELKTHWKLNCLQADSLKFYGITKDPETEEIMMIMKYAKEGNLRNKLAHRCMNANPNQRPTANELREILICWNSYLTDLGKDEKFGYKREEVKAVFEEADKEIPNISTSYEKKPDAIYTSRTFTFKNLSKPINSSFIATTYLNEEDNEGCQDSQLVGLEISSSLKLKDNDVDN